MARSIGFGSPLSAIEASDRRLEAGHRPNLNLLQDLGPVAFFRLLRMANQNTRGIRNPSVIAPDVPEGRCSGHRLTQQGQQTGTACQQYEIQLARANGEERRERSLRHGAYGP